MALNKVMLMGIVERKPEVRYTEQGVAVASVQLGTVERGYRLQNGTSVPPRKDLHNVVLWRDLAEYVETHVKPGDRLYVEGKKRQRSYTDQSGHKHYLMEVYAETMGVLPTPAVAPVQAAAGGSAAPDHSSADAYPLTLNKVMLIGNVGREPDVRHLDNGVAVATFSLATGERGYRQQNGTEVPERTDWHDIVLWRRLAETAERYVHKGDRLFIEGKMRTRSYDDPNNGMKRTITEVFADNMEMLTLRSAVVPASGTASPTGPAGAGPTDVLTSRDSLPF